MMLFSFLLATMTVAASPPSSPYVGFSQFVKREDDIANFTERSLIVDLGYEIYEGWTNTSASLNIWQGYVSRPGHRCGLQSWALTRRP